VVNLPFCLRSSHSAAPSRALVFNGGHMIVAKMVRDPFTEGSGIGAIAWTASVVSKSADLTGEIAYF
jgi:hypothetical protein